MRLGQNDLGGDVKVKLHRVVEVVRGEQFGQDRNGMSLLGKTRGDWGRLR